MKFIGSSFKKIQRFYTQFEHLFSNIQIVWEDKLTHVYNRSYLLHLAERELSIAKRYNRPFSVGMLDIDNFKKINDTYGHPTGDEVLKQMATIIDKTIRDTDMLGRYGGEEFILIFPETDEARGILAAKRIVEAVAKDPIKTKKVQLNMTVSIGLTTLKKGDETMAQLIDRSDAGLYSAKANGKNQVVLN